MAVIENKTHLNTGVKKTIVILGVDYEEKNSQFPLDKFINLYKSCYNICFLHGFKPNRYPNYKEIPKEFLIQTKNTNNIIILVVRWHILKSFTFLFKFNIILLTYFSPCNIEENWYLITMREYFNKIPKLHLCLNLLKHDYYGYYNKFKYLIGDIHIDNLLYKQNLPEYDIVYYPNFNMTYHAYDKQNTLTNCHLYKETEIIYDILQKYKNKYSIITLPHPSEKQSYFTNGLKFINPKFNHNNIEFIPKAKVIINSCKSFAGVCMTLNKPLIHIADHSPITFLSCIDEFIKKGSYYLTEFNEKTFEQALMSALNDEKKEIRNEIVDKYRVEIYDENMESPTEKLKKIIDNIC